MKLREIRLSQGRQQKELAAAVGTDEPMMSRFERYKCLPVPIMLLRITQELKCGIGDIYEPHEVYYGVVAPPAVKCRKKNVYRLTAELPEEARVFFKSGALLRCGFSNIAAWANWCYTELKKRSEKIQRNEMPPDISTGGK